MAYARHHAATINFAMPGGETASCTVRFDVPSGTFYSQAQQQAAADAFRVPVATTIATAGARLSTNVFLTTVLLRDIADGGETIAVAESLLAGPTNGIGTTSMPNEVCVVASLLTTTPGRRTRGRIYWPALACTIGSGGKLTAGQSATIAQAVRDILVNGSAALATALGGTAGDHAPIVASKVGGTNTLVTSVRAGDIADVQRRRQYDLIESYAAVAI